MAETLPKPMNFSSTSFPRPKDWQLFERQARVLFECIFGDPQTQTHGRGGQRQDGVDIYGRRDGGKGRLVGIQCKGRDADYGGPVTENELKKEVQKTEKFKPALEEFILITTAPDDKHIQENARLLEEELKRSGRDLSVAVWGWGLLEQHISQYPVAVKAFLPDGSPFSDQLLEGQALIIEGQHETQNFLAEIKALIKQQNLTSLFEPERDRKADERFDSEIDQYRELIKQGRSKTALQLFESLRLRVWDNVSDRIRFRILGNIGSALNRLGRHKNAAAAFIEAASYDPDNPVAIANRVAGLLLLGDRDTARQEVERAIVRFPKSNDLALQILQIRNPKKGVNEVWGTLSDAVKIDPDVIAVRIALMREEGDASWRDEAKRQAAIYAGSDKLSLLMAEGVLDEFLTNDPSLLGSGPAAPIKEEKLKEAATIFEKSWERSLKSEEEPDVVSAHNAVICFIALNDEHSAATLADEVIKTGAARDATKKLRISLYLRNDQAKEALALASGIAHDPEGQLGLAELFVTSDPEQARRLVRDVSSVLQEQELRILAANIMLESFVAEKQWREALAEAELVCSAFPEHPSGCVLKYRVLSAQGESNAKDALLAAYGLLTPEIDFPTRLMIARALERAELHEEAARSLEGYIDLERDSLALRTFLSAAQNSDRRTTVSKALELLPERTLSDPFYLRLKVALALRIGDTPAAEKGLRDYLRGNPRDLKMYLQLLAILARSNQIAIIKLELARSFADFDGDPEDSMHLALFMDTYADWRKAHELAYRTWLNNQASPAVNLRYVAIFLRPGHSSEMPVTLDSVGLNAAFGLVARGERQKFVIESDSSLRGPPHVIAPDHQIALSSIDKKVGEHIAVRGLEYTIEWIKPKELDALHKILETFNLYFPTDDRLHRITIDRNDPSSIGQITDGARNRSDAIRLVFDSYASSPIPIVIAAQVLGSDPVDTFLGLIELGYTVRVCDGNKPERTAAFVAIRQNERRGCVVDAITLNLIRRLRLEEAVLKTCGSIGVVDHIVLRYQMKRDELLARIDEPDLSISWRDGQAYRTETSVERKREALKEVEADIDWIENHTQKLKAEGLDDAPEAIRDIIRLYGPTFADEYLAAQGHNRLLLSEDMVYRRMGSETLQLNASWLQPVLMIALSEGNINQEKYSEAIFLMVDSHFRFISIDSNSLLAALREAQASPLPRDFLIGVGALGGDTAEIESHLNVATEVMVRVWNAAEFSRLVKRAATGALLDTLIRQRPRQVTAIVRKVVSLGSRTIGNRAAFHEYVRSWAKGHFLDLSDSD